MFRINTLDEAKVIWEAFNKKFSIENPDLKRDEEKEQKRKKFYSKPSDDEKKEIAKQLDKKFDEKDVEKVKTIQRLWRRKRLFTNESHITVNPKGNHHRDFLHLLGKYAVIEDQKTDKKRSEDKKENGKIIRLIHKDKLKRLKKAMQTGNWDAEILAPTTLEPDEKTNKHFTKGSKEYELSMLTLSLFSSQDITQQQAYTLLEYSQIVKEYRLKKVYRILDKEGNFTKEACDIFLPSLKRLFFHDLSVEKQAALKLLIQALPKSEQVFYTTHPKRSQSHLTNTLLKLDAIYATQTELVHFSSGIHDALGLVQFCLNVDQYDSKSTRRRSNDKLLYLDGFTKCMPTLGTKTIAHIENGTQNDARYGALNYPYTTPYESIHNYKKDETDDFNALAHDRYHSTVMSLQSMTPDAIGNRKGIRLASIRIINRIRAVTKIHNSKEIWHFIDANFQKLLHTNKSMNYKNLNNVKRANIFSDTILYSADYRAYGSFLLEIKTQPPRSITEGLMLSKMTPSSLTAMGALVLIDMVSSRDSWLEMGIDPKGLTGGLLEYFKIADLIYKEHLEARNELIQILKLQFYINLISLKKASHFKEISKLIDDNKDFILKKITFKKITKSKVTDSNQINSIALFYENDIFPNAPSYHFKKFEEGMLSDIRLYQAESFSSKYSNNILQDDVDQKLNKDSKDVTQKKELVKNYFSISPWYNTLKAWKKVLFCFSVPIGISLFLFVIGTGIGAAILGLSTVLAVLGGIATGTSFVGLSSAGAIAAGAAIDTAVSASFIASSTAIHLSLNSAPGHNENDSEEHNYESSSASSDHPVENPIKTPDNPLEKYELRNGLS